jgi:SAM-dependent methyltransferase
MPWLPRKPGAEAFTYSTFMCDWSATNRHWNSIFRDRDLTEVSWFQQEPTVSLEMLEWLGVSASASVIDVGGGASFLIDRLLERGFTDLSVLDVSDAALAHSRRRVGSASGVVWLHADVLAWVPTRHYDIWHDRAVFHFLTDPVERDSYLDKVARALGSGGFFVLAAFAEDGPETCSGLPVERYSVAKLRDLFGPRFRILHTRREEHVTPSGAAQPFTWVVAEASPRAERSSKDS